MGADIYLLSVFEPNRAKCAPLFSEACKARGRLHRFSADKESAQRR